MSRFIKTFLVGAVITFAFFASCFLFVSLMPYSGYALLGVLGGFVCYSVGALVLGPNIK